MFKVYYEEGDFTIIYYAYFSQMYIGGCMLVCSVRSWNQLT